MRFVDDRPLRWRLWWRFGWIPFCRLLRMIPMADWRREAISYPVDVWAMDHIGRRRPLVSLVCALLTILASLRHAAPVSGHGYLEQPSYLLDERLVQPLRCRRCGHVSEGWIPA